MCRLCDFPLKSHFLKALYRIRMHPSLLIQSVPMRYNSVFSDDMQKGSRIPQNAAALILQLRFRRFLRFTGLCRIVIRNGDVPL